MPNLVAIISPSLEIVGKTQTGIFSISRFMVNPYKKKCHNFRISNNVDMKLKQVTKINKRNKRTSKHFMDYFCQQIVTSFFSPLYGQFRVIRKPDSGCLVCKIYIFINSSFLSYKNWKKTKKSVTQLSHYYFE